MGGQLALAKRLRDDAFDWAVLLPDSVRAAVGPRLAGVPRRAGYARDPARRALINDVVPLPRDARGQRLPIPMVERYLRITRNLGCRDQGEHVELAVAPDDAERVAGELRAAGVTSGQGIAVVSPGASFGPSKLWPTEHFAEACNRLERELGLRAVVASAPDELPLARALVERTDHAVLWRPDGSATLGALKALVARSALTLSNDTGTRHVAVALGVPTVVLMGSTDPRHTACNLKQQRVLREDVDCSPCQKKVCPIDHRCMTRVTTDRVVAEARSLLAST